MHVDSLAYRTDLSFPRFDGTVVDRGGYLVAHSPANPGYYWGNFLLFAHAPGAGDLARWQRLFEREFGHDAAVRHQSFGWDAVDGDLGDIAPFTDAGFELVDDAVLALDARAARDPGTSAPELRALEGDADWAAMTALNIACDPQDVPDTDYALFKQRLRTRYRRMVEGGLGVWLGAFAGDRLIGQLGLFASGQLARFQSVETHPEHRRRGVGTALVARACRVGLTELGAARLVVVANDGSSAQRIYQSVGFRTVERQVGAHRGPVNGR